MNHQLLVNLMRPGSNRIPIAKIAGGRVNCFYDHALAKTEIVQFQSSLKDPMLMSADFLGERSSRRRAQTSKMVSYHPPGHC